MRALNVRDEMKSIARTIYLKRLPYSNANYFYYKRGIRRKTKIFKTGNQTDTLKLNHYITKSKEEYEKKKKAIFHKNKYDDDKFYALEKLLNVDVDGGDILRFVEPVKEKLNKYLRD